MTAIAVLVLPAATLSVPPKTVPAPDNQYEPAVAFDGTNYFVVWRDDRTVSDIHGARVTQAGLVLDEDSIPVSTAPGYQWFPAVAFDGTNYLVVWQSSVGDEHHIYGARVSPSGVVLDPSGILISSAAGGQAEPAVAFDGTNYFVVWRDMRTGGSWRIYGACVTPTGMVLDPNGIPISRNGGDGVPGRAGRRLRPGELPRRVVRRVEPVLRRLRGARDAGRRHFDPSAFPISEIINEQRSPAVEFGGANYLVVWEDGRTQGVFDIQGSWVTPAGLVLDPGATAPAARATATAPTPADRASAAEPAASAASAASATASAAATTASRAASTRAAAATPSTAADRASTGEPVASAAATTPDPALPRPSRDRPAAGAGPRSDPTSELLVGTGARTKSRRVGRVLAQTPRAGAVRRAGHPVGLLVGRR